LKALSEIGVIFFTWAIAVTAAYTHSAVILSLGRQVAQDLIGSNNALVNGAAISLFAIVSGVVAMLAKQIPTCTAIVTDSFAHLVAQAGWSVNRRWISAAPHFAAFI
jgi:ABC-type enterochelin transport system permease subunit